MKLIRVGQPGEEKPGVLREDGTRVDVSAFGEDFGETFFGTDGPARLARWLETQSDLHTFGAEALSYTHNTLPTTPYV